MVLRIQRGHGRRLFPEQETGIFGSYILAFHEVGAVCGRTFRRQEEGEARNPVTCVILKLKRTKSLSFCS